MIGFGTMPRALIGSLAGVALVALSGCADPQQGTEAIAHAQPARGGASTGVSTTTNPGAGAGSASLALPAGGWQNPLGSPCPATGTPAGANSVSAPTPTFTSLPADFVPVRATRCVYLTTRVPGKGEWLYLEEQRATTGLAALAAALRPTGPSPSLPKGAACSDIGVIPIVITLIDAKGRTLTPALPVDACGIYRHPATAAIGRLPWQTFRRTPVHQLTGELAISSGCQEQYKGVIALNATSGVRRTPSPGSVLPTVPGSVRLTVCRYRLDHTDSMQVGSGATFYSGRLASTGTLTGDQARRFLTAVDAAPAVTRTCSAPQAPFAMVSGDGVPGPIAVELGGCDRALDGSDALRQLTPATVALLGAL